MPRPRVGDNVWVEGHAQPNGVVVNIDWHDKEVHVKCHDTSESIALEWDQFVYFNDQLNQWQISLQ